MNLVPPSYSRCPPLFLPIGLYFRARYTEFIKAKETDVKINVIKITSCAIKGSFLLLI